MSKLIDELKSEHSSIMASMERVRSADIGTEAGYTTVVELMHYLRGHIEKEEKAFYPPLREAAKCDDRLKNILGMVEAEIRAVVMALDDFLAKCSYGIVTTDFIEDFNSLSEMLRTRIVREESTLFPEYESQFST